jgi:RNA polymerase sigma factor (sigma-70 family)
MVTEADTRGNLNADIARVAAGDRAALRRVYAATSARLFGICLRFAHDRDDAEDALQETYVKVWRRAERFDPARASAMTWLCLIARGTAIDAARASGRATRGMAALHDHADLTSSVPDGDRAALDECLNLLDENARHNIRSAFFDGYSYDELASRAEVPLGTMKSRIRRGLMALRRCLDDA